MRGDYREVALISRFMLAGELRGGEKMKWTPPSSTSKARFLAQGICCQKLLVFSKSQVVKDKIFSNRVNVGTEKKKKWVLVEDLELLARLKRYANYAVRFYMQYFLTARGRGSSHRPQTVQRPRELQVGCSQMRFRRHCCATAGFWLRRW